MFDEFAAILRNDGIEALVLPPFLPSDPGGSAKRPWLWRPNWFIERSGGRDPMNRSFSDRSQLQLGMLPESRAQQILEVIQILPRQPWPTLEARLKVQARPANLHPCAAAAPASDLLGALARSGCFLFLPAASPCWQPEWTTTSRRGSPQQEGLIDPASLFSRPPTAKEFGNIA